MEDTSRLFASRGGKTDYKEVDFHHSKLKEASPKPEGGLLLPPVVTTFTPTIRRSLESYPLGFGVMNPPLTGQPWSPPLTPPVSGSLCRYHDSGPSAPTT